MWRYLIGATENISLAHKIFNSVCIFSFLGISISILFNLVLGISDLALFQSVFLILQAFIYYLSRVQKAHHTALILFAFANYLFLSVNFFFNNGLTGPTLLACFVSFHFLAAITPSKITPWWVAGHIVVVGLLSAVQFFYPETVRATYSSIWSQFADINITFYISVLITYFITISVRNRFYQERRKVAEQKSIIEEKNKRLEYIDKERNRLFSIIAHDLRSPLTTIHGYLDLLTSGVLDEEERMDTEKQLLSLSTHTSAMLNNLLQWSKNQLEGNKVSLETLYIGEALNNTINLQRSIARKKGVLVTVDIHKSLTMYANRDFIEIVVRNLLSNAVKFTEPGGQIEIAAKTENGISSILVKDDGIGISDAQKPYIFNTEIKPSRGTDDEKGIGLGLVMCKEFVEKQGGTIDFVSTEDAGTTFIVRLSCGSA